MLLFGSDTNRLLLRIFSEFIPKIDYFESHKSEVGKHEVYNKGGCVVFIKNGIGNNNCQQNKQFEKCSRHIITYETLAIISAH